MSNLSLGALGAIFLSLIGVIGDYLLKLASTELRPFSSPTFLIGFIVYSSTAFGWVLVMRHLKLASIGAIYGVSTAIFLLVAGNLVGEKLTLGEMVGVFLALLSIILLRRFA